MLIPRDSHVTDPSEVRRLTGQNADVLRALRRGPQSASALAAIALKYTSRISDLREAGYIIRYDKQRQLYTLVPPGEAPRVDGPHDLNARGDCDEQEGPSDLIHFRFMGLIVQKTVENRAIVGENTLTNETGRSGAETPDAALTTDAEGGIDMADSQFTRKSPAFQFYPDTFLSDANVIAMSLQERGAYITLICICWIEGSLPTDTAKLARLCGAPHSSFRKLWPNISPCFRAAGDQRMVHPRLEKEKKKQREYQRRQSDAANMRWQSQRNATAMPPHRSGNAKTAMPPQCSLSPSLSPSLDSSQVVPLTGARSKRPLFRGQSFVVFEWQLDDLRRMLGRHTEGFDLHAWFFDLDAKAVAAGLVVPQRDGGKWLQEQTLSEAIRRGLPVAASAAPVVNPKTAGNAASAAIFIARGQR